MSPPRRRKPTAQAKGARSNPRPNAARSNARRRQPAGRDFWGADDIEESPAAVIRPIPDPTALVRSLGPPPLPGYETAAEHYFAAVYDKAATLAIALAAASGLLATDEPDD
jgi:hypothetical protein